MNPPIPFYGQPQRPPPNKQELLLKLQAITKVNRNHDLRFTLTQVTLMKQQILRELHDMDKEEKSLFGILKKSEESILKHPKYPSIKLQHKNKVEGYMRLHPLEKVRIFWLKNKDFQKKLQDSNYRGPGAQHSHLNGPTRSQSPHEATSAHPSNAPQKNSACIMGPPQMNGGKRAVRTNVPVQMRRPLSTPTVTSTSILTTEVKQRSISVPSQLANSMTVQQSQEIPRKRSAKNHNDATNFKYKKLSALLSDPSAPKDGEVVTSENLERGNRANMVTVALKQPSGRDLHVWMKPPVAHKARVCTLSQPSPVVVQNIGAKKEFSEQNNLQYQNNSNRAQYRLYRSNDSQLQPQAPPQAQNQTQNLHQKRFPVRIANPSGSHAPQVTQTGQFRQSGLQSISQTSGSSSQIPSGVPNAFQNTPSGSHVNLAGSLGRAMNSQSSQGSSFEIPPQISQSKGQKTRKNKSSKVQSPPQDHQTVVYYVESEPSSTVSPPPITTMLSPLAPNQVCFQNQEQKEMATSTNETNGNGTNIDENWDFDPEELAKSLFK